MQSHKPNINPPRQQEKKAINNRKEKLKEPKFAFSPKHNSHFCIIFFQFDVLYF